MKKLLTITALAFAAITSHAAEQPDLHRIARDIERQTGGTYDDARHAAQGWAKRNGYDY
jgi:hypothetical protein